MGDRGPEARKARGGPLRKGPLFGGPLDVGGGGGGQPEVVSPSREVGPRYPLSTHFNLIWEAQTQSA